MNDREYQRLKSAIEEEYRTSLDALERIWKLSRKHNGSSGPKGRGNLLAAVRQAVLERHTVFNLRDIEDAIKKRDPGMTIRRPSLSSTLMRLVEDGDIEVVEKGSGRMPSTYRQKAKAG
jgi:hypothetical protein